MTLINYGDNSLLGAEPNGINNYGIDEPDVASGPLNLNHNPRNGQPYFNAALFSENALGTPGDASRRYFHGPGMENFDMALLKNLRLTESKSLQFRIEAFNVFNHAQFFGPQAVDGNISSSTFGQVVNAAAPRLVQLGAKFAFLKRTKSMQIYKDSQRCAPFRHLHRSAFSLRVPARARAFRWEARSPLPRISSANTACCASISPTKPRVDQNGNTLYCFMTASGAESPTLHVHPGDRLLINLTNNVPAFRRVLNAGDGAPCRE